MNLRRSFFVGLAFLVGLPLVGLGTAGAGTVSSDAWLPSAACGARPVDVPKLDTHHAETYNASLRKVNDYRQRLRDYVDCVVREANADIQLVSKSAQAIQQSARETDEQIQLDAKTAREKLN